MRGGNSVKKTCRGTCPCRAMRGSGIDVEVIKLGPGQFILGGMLSPELIYESDAQGKDYDLLVEVALRFGMAAARAAAEAKGHRFGWRLFPSACAAREALAMASLIRANARRNAASGGMLADAA